jgi:Spy/CpxP family protein refolding chaperone
MKSNINALAVVVICAILFCVSAATGQGLSPVRSSQEDTPRDTAPGRNRADLLQELGLTADQLQEMRRINQERRPSEIAARQRFQDATRALNAVIYSDSPDDALFDSSLKEYQAAQSELARIKFTSELAIRKLLTPEQLQRFRELRRRFAESRGNRRNQFQPLRRMRRGARQMPN